MEPIEPMEPTEPMETQQMRNGAMRVQILWQNSAEKGAKMEPTWSQLMAP